MFVVNLAFCDLVMFCTMPIFVYNSFYQTLAVGMVGCRLYAGISSLAGIGASMTNACIAYDRYTTITRPFDGKITRTKAALMLLFVWLYTFPWGMLPFFEIWGKFVPGKKQMILINCMVN